MASASVLFVILVGVVTFSAWPQAGSLLGDGGVGGDVALQQAPTPLPARATAASSGPNLVKLLGGGARTAPPVTAEVRGGRVGRTGDGLIPGGGGGGRRGGSNVPSSQPPASPQAGSPQTGSPQTGATPKQSNVVSETVSAVGNTVQKDTESLGDTLGGSSGPGVGGVLGGLGRTLNNDLQTLAGKH